MERKAAQETEKMRKAYNLLQICARAGQLKTGFDTAYKSLKQGRAKILILAKDLSERNRQKLEKICNQNGTPCFELGSKSIFGEMLVKKDTGILFTCDRNFAKGLLKIFDDKAVQTDQEV